MTSREFGGPGEPRLEPYRGHDRRRARRPLRIPAAQAIAALVVAMAAGVAVVWVDQTTAWTATSELVRATRSAVLVTTIFAAAAALLHGRATGAASSVRIGIALCVVVVLAILRLWPPFGPSTLAARLVLVGVAATWVAYGVIGPTVDTAARHARTAVLSISVGLVGAVVLAVAAIQMDPTWVVLVRHAAAAAAWLGVGYLGTRRHPDGVEALVAWGCIAGGVSEAGRAIAVVSVPGSLAPHSAGGALSALVLVVVSVGFLRDLAHSTSARREELHEVRLQRLRQRDAERRSARERNHEFRNAVFALEGAILTLERHGQELDHREREALETAVRSGLRQLHELSEPREHEPRATPLLEVARNRAFLSRVGDEVSITVSGDEQVVAAAPEAVVAQVLDNLLVNAQRHGRRPGRPCQVELRVVAGAERAIVSVTDAGYGIPEEHREHVFAAGVSLSPAGGEGLGLHVVRDLVQRQGGDVHLEAAPSGGARFVVSLPRALYPVPGPQTGDEPDERVDVEESTSLERAVATDAPAAATLRGLIQFDDDGSIDAPAVAADQGDIEPVRRFAPQLVGQDGDRDVRREERPQAVRE